MSNIKTKTCNMTKIQKPININAGAMARNYGAKWPNKTNFIPLQQKYRKKPRNRHHLYSLSSYCNNRLNCIWHEMLSYQKFRSFQSLNKTQKQKKYNFPKEKQFKELNFLHSFFSISVRSSSWILVLVPVFSPS